MEKLGDDSNNPRKEAILPRLTPLEKQIAFQAALKIDPGVKRWALTAIQARKYFFL